MGKNQNNHRNQKTTKNINLQEYALPLYGFLMPVLVLFTTAINASAFCIRFLLNPPFPRCSHSLCWSCREGICERPPILCFFPWHWPTCSQVSVRCPGFYSITRCAVLSCTNARFCTMIRANSTENSYPGPSRLLVPSASIAIADCAHHLAHFRHLVGRLPGCPAVHLRLRAIPSSSFLHAEQDQEGGAGHSFGELICQQNDHIFDFLQCSLLTELPELFGKRMERVNVGPEQNMCLLRYSGWVRHGLGVDLFFSLHYWFRVALVHALPCFLLLVFTLALTKTIKKANFKGNLIISCIFQAQLRRRSWATNGIIEQPPVPAEEEQQPLEQCNTAKSPQLLSPPGEALNRNGSTASTLSLKKSASWGGCSPVPPSNPFGGGPNGGRSLDATNRMLAAICSVFLLIEVRGIWREMS